MSVRALAILGLCAVNIASGQRVGAPTDDLGNLSVEDLFQVQVTSVGRKAQQLSTAPAAIYVLTADDIRRSGASSIPEALQWVPGLGVLRVDGRSWTISARGSASLYADKMLVMIDGRSLYTPLFGGVIWDAIDVPLEDIEQIEVMRGPGAVMWGPNAVNGVINIITKSARATKGGQVSVATGNERRGQVFARWGAAPNEHLAYRFWAKLDEVNPAFSSDGYYNFNGGYIFQDPRRVDHLESRSARLGFRVDADPTARDHLLITGDAFKMGRHDMLAYPVLVAGAIDATSGHTDYTGGVVQLRWTRSASTGNESNLQFSFDKQQLSYPFIGGALNNMTIDYEKRLQRGERNEIYFGAGYQQYWDDTSSQQYVSFDPPSSVYRVGDIVARDEIQLWRDRLLLSLGMRVDYSSYTGFEFQPSVRLLFTPSRRQSAWIAYSRGARIPSRFERGMRAELGAMISNGVPVTIAELGSESFRSETERSVELGYRFQSGQRWSIDVSTFESSYDGLRALRFPDQLEMAWSGGGMPTLLAKMVETNAGSGRSYGGEIAGVWQVRQNWKLIPSYSFLDEERWFPPNYSWDFQSSGSRHQGFLRSQHDLSRKWQLDLMARARSKNTAFDLPGVLLLDARLGWRASPRSEISFNVKNLTDRRVLETYSEVPFVAIPLDRTFIVRWTQSF